MFYHYTFFSLISMEIVTNKSEGDMKIWNTKFVAQLGLIESRISCPANDSYEDILNHYFFLFILHVN